MTMAMIVSLAKQLCRSPRLVPPRFRLVAAESRPKSLLMIFFHDERLHIAEDGHWRDTRGPTRQGRAPRGVGRAPHPHGQGVAPLVNFLRSVFFIYSGNSFHEFQDFWSCAE